MTGMAAILQILRQTLLDLRVGRAACAVAVAGSTMPEAVARRIVTATTRRTVATSLACG